LHADGLVVEVAEGNKFFADEVHVGEQVSVGAGCRGSQAEVLASGGAADKRRSLLCDEPVQAG
jgi:hypothetical protein